MKQAPILLIGYNRPNNMREVFAQIRKAKPNVLYIAVDGPHPDKDGEEEKCQQCRDLAKQVDWPCELHTLFREKNVGCALGVSGAITWAFENEDRLIVLEDDCVPVLSFFSFCNEMLERYKDDTRVWQVCARSNHANSEYFKDSDYIFSHFAHIWGWATWKRCWMHYDLYMSDFPQFISIGGTKNVYQSKRIAKKINKSYGKMYKTIEKVSSHTWDYQWSYTKAKNAGLGIVPCKNLVHNIGLASGVHSADNKAIDISCEEMPSVIRHPHFVIPNYSYDAFHFKKHINKKPSLIRKAIRKIKREGLTSAVINYYTGRRRLVHVQFR